MTTPSTTRSASTTTTSSRTAVINGDGVGGGISLNTGSDAYKVQKNWVCGNFSVGSGAGIGHLGFSHGGLIEDNSHHLQRVLQPGTRPSPAAVSTSAVSRVCVPIDVYLLSPGTGNVTIDANLIRGNLAGAGDGGGIRIENVNGEDILAQP